MSPTDTMSQMALKEPDQVSWEILGGSAYQAPLPAQDAAGKAIVYQGVAEITLAEPDNDYLQYLLDPLTIKGTTQTIRFTRVSTKTFQRNGVNMKGNPNRLATFLRSCGITAKPTTNAEYMAAMGACKGRTFSFTLDWEAYNKDTGERVKGFLAFPEDPERPGQRKSILKAGDVVSVLDNKGKPTGETHTVTSEILFANMRVRYFNDATPKVGV